MVVVGFDVVLGLVLVVAALVEEGVVVVVVCCLETILTAGAAATAATLDDVVVVPVAALDDVVVVPVATLDDAVVVLAATLDDVVVVPVGMELDAGVDEGSGLELTLDGELEATVPGLDAMLLEPVARVELEPEDELAGLLELTLELDV